jgi:hypothetical protein
MLRARLAPDLSTGGDSEIFFRKVLKANNAMTDVARSFLQQVALLIAGAILQRHARRVESR